MSSQHPLVSQPRPPNAPTGPAENTQQRTTGYVFQGDPVPRMLPAMPSKVRATVKTLWSENVLSS